MTKCRISTLPFIHPPLTVHLLCTVCTQVLGWFIKKTPGTVESTLSCYRNFRNIYWFFLFYYEEQFNERFLIFLLFSGGYLIFFTKNSLYNILYSQWCEMIFFIRLLPAKRWWRKLIILILDTRRKACTLRPSPSTATRPPWSHNTANRCSPRCNLPLNFTFMSTIYCNLSFHVSFW